MRDADGEPPNLPTGIFTTVLALFSSLRYRLLMTIDPKLSPATPEETAETLEFAPQFTGRKRTHTARIGGKRRE